MIEYTPYMVPLFVTAVIAFLLLIIGLSRRKMRGGLPFCIIMVLIMNYSIGYALELGSQTVPTALLLNRIQYLSIATLAPSWLVLVLIYTGHPPHLTPKRTALVYLIPAITILLTWTNDFHGFIWQNITLDQSFGFTRWRSDYGFWFNIHLFYTYVSMFVATFVIIRTFVKSPKSYRQQITAMLLASFFPWLGNIVWLVSNPFPLNPTPFLFGITSLMTAWALFGTRFLDLVPVARELVMEKMSDAMIILDEANRIIDLNPAALVLFQLSEAELIGRSIVELLPNRPELIDQYKDAIQATGEIELLVQGKTEMFELQIDGLYGGTEGERSYNGRVIVLHNITHQKETERALRDALERAETADRAKSAFLANMTHELRTPLTIILGYAELIEEVLKEEDSAPYLLDKLAKINQSGNHLLSIISDVLDISKIEAGRIQLDWQIVDLDALMQEVIQLAKPLLLEAENEFVYEIGTLRSIETDPTKLTQILMNLLSNAAKFTHQGRVSLVAGRYEKTIQIAVGDTGIGMTSEQMRNLFQPFSQADASTTRQYGGTGLGLSISLNLARLLGGDIEVTSEEGQGSLFMLTLPCIKPSIVVEPEMV